LKDSDCPLKKGYTVSCDKSPEVKERVYDIHVDLCEENKPGGIFGVIVNLFPKLLFGEDICDIKVQTGITIVGIGLSPSLTDLIFATPSTPDYQVMGLCIAESTTWYGKMWDSTLDMVGGLDIPAQYVLIVTILLLFLLVGLLINILK